MISFDDVWFPWILLACMAVASIAVVWSTLAYYLHTRGRDSCLVMTISILTLTFCLALMSMLVVDTYSVSNRAPEPAQPLPTIQYLVDQRTRPVMYWNYGLFGGAMIMISVAIPFGFFYFEESDSYGFQLPEYGKNTAKGAKYALLFLAAPLAVFFLAALSQYGESRLSSNLAETHYGWLNSTRLSWAQCAPKVLGIPTPSGREHAPVCWVWEAAANFVIAVVGLVGMLGFVAFGGVGLAALPLHIIKTPRSVVVLEGNLYEREALLHNRYDQIESKQRQHGSGALSRRERRDLQLATEERRDIVQQRGQLQASQSSMHRCINQIGCCKYILGGVLLLLSLFIAQAVAIATVDDFLQSPGWRFGFAAVQPSKLADYNGLQRALAAGCGLLADPTANHSFSDFVIVMVLLGYMLPCMMYGMYIVGVFGLVRVRPHRTREQDMLSAIWVLTFSLVTLWMMLPTWAPQYFAFGCQQTVDGDACPWSDASLDPNEQELFCVVTQSTVLRITTRLAMPLMGVAYFAANAGLVVTFVCAALYYACRTRATNADALSDDDDDDDIVF